MNNCPCCSKKMLRHVSHNRIYWYCTSCHQEMPNFEDPLKGFHWVSKQKLLLMSLPDRKELVAVN